MNYISSSCRENLCIVTNLWMTNSCIALIRLYIMNIEGVAVVLCSSGMLYSMDWWPVTDVLGQPTSPIFTGRVCPKMSVTKYQSLLLDIPTEQRSHALHSKSQKNVHEYLLFDLPYHDL